MAAFFTVYRGDTSPIPITITDPNNSDAAVNVTGFTFVMTINSEEDPTNTDNQLASIPGTIVDGPNGQVQFEPTSGDVDLVGGYFFDIQWTDGSSKIKTIKKGEIEFIQDITK